MTHIIKKRLLHLKNILKIYFLYQILRKLFFSAWLTTKAQSDIQHKDIITSNVCSSLFRFFFTFVLVHLVAFCALFRWSRGWASVCVWVCMCVEERRFARDAGISLQLALKWSVEWGAFRWLIGLQTGHRFGSLKCVQKSLIPHRNLDFSQFGVFTYQRKFKMKTKSE